MRVGFTVLPGNQKIRYPEARGQSFALPLGIAVFLASFSNGAVHKQKTGIAADSGFFRIRNLNTNFQDFASSVSVIGLMLLISSSVE